MKALLFSHIGLKLVALLMALVSWYAIRETISFEVQIPDIPLEINIGEGWAVLHQSENTVQVTFRGSQDDIRLLDHKQIRAGLNLSTNSMAGLGTVAVTEQDIKGARGVRVVRVAPDRISVSLDREVEKKVPVKARSVGKPFAGEVESLLCDPAIVLIHGPAQELSRTEWVYADPVDVDGRVESFTKRCRIQPPSNTWTPRFEPGDVQVRVVIARKLENREWKDVPVMVVTAPGSRLKVTVTPARVTALLAGRTEGLDGLPANGPRVFVDCVDLDPSLAYDLPAQVSVPPGQDITATADPSHLHVTLESP